MLHPTVPIVQMRKLRHREAGASALRSHSGVQHRRPTPHPLCNDASYTEGPRLTHPSRTHPPGSAAQPGPRRSPLSGPHFRPTPRPRDNGARAPGPGRAPGHGSALPHPRPSARAAPQRPRGPLPPPSPGPRELPTAAAARARQPPHRLSGNPRPLIARPAPVPSSSRSNRRTPPARAQ